MNASILEGLNISLLNIDCKKVNDSWDYADIISPFTRIFYVTKGEAQIIHQNIRFALVPGKCYLIPSFTRCTYKCEGSMTLYYIHIIINLVSGINFFEEFEINPEIMAHRVVSDAFIALHKLHPDRMLPDDHPDKYQSLTWQLKAGMKNMAPSVYLQTQGLLAQILSKFILGFRQQAMHNHSRYKAIKESVRKINSAEKLTISVNDLAKSSCLAPDYYSRLFKKICGVSPQEYISGKKLERAIMLLNTSSKSIESIAETLGFENTQNFTRFFKNRTNTTPGKFRKIKANYLFG